MAKAYNINSHASVGSAIALGTLGVLSFIIQPALVQGFVSHLGVDEAEAVNLAGMEMLGVAIAAIVFALPGLRVDWRRALSGALALAIVGNGLSAVFSDNSSLWPARLLAGLGHGALISLSFTFVGLTQRVERNIALYLTLLLSYGALGVWILPQLLDIVGLSGLFIGFCGLLALGFLTVHHVPRSSDAREQIPESARDLSRPLVVTALAGVLCYNLAQGIAWAILFLVGLDAGLSEQSVANALFWSQVLAIGGALASVFLAESIGRSMAIAIGIWVGAACIALLLSRPDYAVFLIAVCGFNILWNFVLPFILAAVAEFDTRGTMVGKAIALQMTGLGLGPFIAAWLIADGDYQPAEWACIGFFAASYVLLRLPMRRHKALLAVATN